MFDFKLKMKCQHFRSHCAVLMRASSPTHTGEGSLLGKCPTGIEWNSALPHQWKYIPGGILSNAPFKGLSGKSSPSSHLIYSVYLRMQLSVCVQGKWNRLQLHHRCCDTYHPGPSLAEDAQLVV